MSAAKWADAIAIAVRKRLGRPFFAHGAIAVLTAVSIVAAAFAQITNAEPAGGSNNKDANPFRTFTDAQGRTVEARMVSVLGNQVEIELKNEGKTLTWPIANFSAVDRDYMKKWSDENTSYRFAIRHRTQANVPRRPLSGASAVLPFPGGGNGAFNGGKVKVTKPTPRLRGNEPGRGINVNDDDSEIQYLTLSLQNGSSAKLKDLDVAVWLILRHKETSKDKNDSSSYVTRSTAVRLPEIDVGQKVDFSGGFPIKKIRLKERVQTVTVTTETSSTTGLPEEIRHVSYSNEDIGTVRETIAGILVRVYHQGRVVDELADFGSVLKSSKTAVDFVKPPVTPVAMAAPPAG